MSQQVVNDSVLVLNRYFMAIQVTIVKEAICALVTGKAKIVDKEYAMYTLEQWKIYTKEYCKTEEIGTDYIGLIRSPTTTILSPQVILLPDCEFNSPMIKTVKYSRRNIYQRDGNTCQYCHRKVGNQHMTLDHVVPKSKGGKSTWSNVVASCTWCNAEKGDKLLSELGWKLDKLPTPPKWKSHVGIPFSKGKKEYWNNFLK